MSKVTAIITAIAGVIFTQSKNEDGTPKLDKTNNKPFGYIRVENPSTVDLNYAFNTGGIKRGQSALVSMSLEAWEKVKNFYKEGMEVPGRVVITESLVQGLGFKAKLAGKDGEACTLDGAPIYRRTEFVPLGAKNEDGSLKSMEDILIAHNNVIKGSSALVVNAQEALNAKK